MYEIGKLLRKQRNKREEMLPIKKLSSGET